MSDDKAVAAARKTPVGNESHILSKPCAHDGRRRSEHFGHTWTALRALVTNHDHVPALDLSLFESPQHLLFGIEHACWAGEAHPFFSGDLCHRAFGRSG